MSVDVLKCINDYSTYWPKCNPSQTKVTGSPAGYEFGHYCTQEWVDSLNEMLTDMGHCGNQEVIKRTLSQVGYETGYYSTIYQPRDAGSGLIHMIPGNFPTCAADMDLEFGTGSTYANAEAAAGQNGGAFFKDPRYGWKSVAAWFKRTNRVIPGCNIDLFQASYDDQTRCILSRVVDRSEIYNRVAFCMGNNGNDGDTGAPVPAPAVGSGCSGKPCTDSPCRSEWGWCGSSNNHCNGKSQWKQAGCR